MLNTENVMNVLLKFEEAPRLPFVISSFALSSSFITWVSLCIGQLLHGGIIKIQKRRTSVFFEMFYL